MSLLRSSTKCLQGAAAAGLAMIGLALGTGMAAASPAVTPGAGPPTKTPIKHFLYLMQENHSFDNYFGTYPGADGIPKGVCMPVRSGDPSKGCVKPFRIGNSPIQDLGHNDKIFARQYNSGALDGFIEAYRQDGLETKLSMGHYDDRDIPYYWNIADNYVLFDRFFTSARGGSVWNHMYWVTGTPGRQEVDVIPPEGFGDLPTIFDRLQEKGIPWKFYVQNYDSRITFRTYRTQENGDRAAQVVWVPLLDYGRYVDDPKLSSHIVPLEQYYKDLVEGTLPAVAYIVPSGSSEHPPGSIQAGERFVRTMLNALKRSPYWSSSAFLWTYDDWGGFYDHVNPPKVDALGLGFRAPAMLVSAYARKGYIDSTVLDFTSGLKFIEENWGVAPLAERDAKANNFLSAFDFNKRPRSPRFLPRTRREVIPPEPKRSIIYLSYGSAVALPAGIMGWAAMKGSLRLRRVHRRGSRTSS